MPELNQLSQLVAVADSGTLSRAAELLHISQPALTRSIQRLEAEWQVTLFDRQKNRVTLNKTGVLAVQHARRVLQDVEAMTDSVQAFARSQRTLSIGSCAPAPILELLNHLPGQLLDMATASETVAPEQLLPGLEKGTYQIVITDHPVEAPGVLCRELCTERLYLTVPPAHPLAAKTEGVYAEDLAGETMLLYKEIGVWKRFHTEKMSQTHFIIQDQNDTFAALLRASALPAFATNLTFRRPERHENRIAIPFLDPEAAVTFYCCVKKENRAYLPEL